MRRVTQDELGFYEVLATRINNLLGDPACSLTQSSLAHGIGWHRVSLCNFLNRIDKTIAAHFIPKIAQTFRLSVDELLSAAAASRQATRCSWDPRADDAEILIGKLGEWRYRNLANLRLHGHLPPVLLPRRGMVANYVCSVFDGGFPDAAERWHDVIDAEVQLITERGEGDVVHIVARRDLHRFSDRDYPFQRFSADEIVYALEMLKKNWVRHRGFALVAVDSPAISPEVRLELASCNSIVAVGREVRVEYGNDFRVRWTENAEAVSSTNDCLVRLKKAAGFGARERPTIRKVEVVIDELLRRVDGGRPAGRSPRNANRWEHRIPAAKFGKRAGRNEHVDRLKARPVACDQPSQRQSARIPQRRHVINCRRGRRGGFRTRRGQGGAGRREQVPGPFEGGTGRRLPLDRARPRKWTFLGVAAHQWQKRTENGAFRAGSSPTMSA